MSHPRDLEDEDGPPLDLEFVVAVQARSPRVAEEQARADLDHAREFIRAMIKGLYVFTERPQNSSEWDVFYIAARSMADSMGTVMAPHLRARSDALAEVLTREKLAEVGMQLEGGH
jgi:hypothetical protein